MSRVVELHQDWMNDPSFRQEFAKLEQELKQLKTVARGRAGKAGSAKPGPLDGAEGEAARKRSA